jgi:hypothetical protein
MIVLSSGSSNVAKIKGARTKHLPEELANDKDGIDDGIERIRRFPRKVVREREAGIKM